MLGVVQVFYDGPNPPAGIFDDFLTAQPQVSSNVETRSFLSLIQSSSPDATAGLR